MITGLLWFDNDPKADLNLKISRATEYYFRRYGLRPDMCFVHPSMIENDSADSIKIEILVNRFLLPDHIWIGKRKLPPRSEVS